MKIEISKQVNSHFENFLFDWTLKYYFLFGGYGSGKSYHIALKIIIKLLQEKRTALVVREVYETIRESCLSLFEEIIDDVDLENYIKLTTSPMSVKFLNGSKIIFKGMDKPQKLKSINNVSVVWIEECSEVKYDGFKELIGRLRHPSLKLHMILSTNPANKNNWTYKHFFENINFKDTELYEKRIVIKDSTYYHHSVADDNLFLPRSYIIELENIKKYDKDLYRVARLGQFGITGILVLPQFEIDDIDNIMQVVHGISNRFKFAGMDFGFETSYNALLRLAVDEEKNTLYIYWEYYKNHQTDDVTAKDLIEFTHTKEIIKADSAEPKTISYFKKIGFNIKPAKKYQGSRIQYIKKCKRFNKIICANTCINTIKELKDLTFKVDRDGNVLADEFNIDSHTFSAIWYGLDKYEVKNLKGQYKNNKVGE